MTPEEINAILENEPQESHAAILTALYYEGAFDDRQANT